MMSTTDVGTSRPEGLAPSGTLSFSMSSLWAIVAVSLPAVATLAARLGTIDLAYLVRVGRFSLESHRLMRVDAFTFTVAGQPWLDQQWFAAILFGAIHRVAGWDGLVVLRSALIGVTFLLVYRSCRSAGAGSRAAALLTLGSFGACLLGLGLRPQLFGFAFFASTAWILAERERHPGRVWILPPLMVLWVNVHGSFFLLPLLLGLTWLADHRERRSGADRLLKVALVCLPLTVLNPFGPRVWAYVVSISTNPAVTKAVTEWAPPTIKDPAGGAFFLSAGALVAFFARRGRPVAWPTLLTLGTFFAIGLVAGRGIFWWDLLVPSIVAGSLRDAHPRTETRVPVWMTGTILATLVVVGVTFLPWLRMDADASMRPSLLSAAPPAITRQVQHLPDGQRLFTAQIWGSWFEYAVPADRVFVDSRIELFPPSVWRNYFQISTGMEGWQQLLDRWDVDVVVASRTQQLDLIPRIRTDPGWRLLYSDDDGAVFVRADTVG